jgi:general secretion pathway protein A
MYEGFFGFREKPFNLTPDPRFLYLSAKHSEAFAHLDFGLKQRGGFVVVTGEVGIGKTTLCRYFLDGLDDNTLSAFILYPALSAGELLRSINDDLGVTDGGRRSKELIDALHRFLLRAREAGKNIVVVIDEAQNLRPGVLEQIRLISNLETSTEKLIQIVLIGQSELNTLLSQKNLRQLAQRVTARYHLNPMSQEETVQYIRHRLRVAGGAGRVSFTPGALREIHRFSKGLPRLINLLCDRVLLAGFVLSRREMDAELVKRATKELDLVHLRPRRWYHSWGFRGALAAIVLGGLALNFWLGDRALVPGAEEAVEAADAGASDRAAASPVAGISAQDFDRRIGTLSRPLSRRGAGAVLLEQWDAEVGGTAALSAEEDLPAIASRGGLQSIELTTHFDQIRRLNLPVVMELFHTTREDTVYVALTGLEGDTAVVFFAPDDSVRISVSLLDRFWVRKAFVFWKDFVESGGTPTDTAWVTECLRKLGYLSSGAGSPSALQAAVGRFQSSNYLVPDRIVGSKTRMALYSRSGNYPVPRLF